MNRPVMTLKSKYIYNAPYLEPACKAADALFQLLRRGTISPNELHWLGQMGFEVKIVGDVKPLSKDLKADGVDHTINNGEISYG
jgi:hypothetical protein